METNCRHLGAEMSHAEIEECDTGVIAVGSRSRCVRPLAGLVYLQLRLKIGNSETGLHTDSGRLTTGWSVYEWKCQRG